MIRLIKSELKKLFHHKSFYIVTFLFILYCLLTNFIYKDIEDLDVEFNSIDIAELENENKSLDLTNSDDLNLYINNLTEIECAKLKENNSDSSNKYLIDNYLKPLISEINEAKYLFKDDSKIAELELIKKEILNRIETSDWKYFVKEKRKDIEEKINNTSDELIKERLNIYLKLNNYRLENNVNFDSNNYLNNAILEIEMDLVEYQTLSNKKSKTKDEEERLQDLESSYLTNEYILKNKVDINNSGTLRAVLKNFSTEYQLFILIYVIMICGSIVSEEFNKGTIKFLLTKPYKRRTILTSKLLTVLLVIPLVILFMVLVEILIGGLILDFKSLNIPILIYNASSNSLVSYNPLTYLVLALVTSFPIYLVLGIICFSLSTITTSTSAAITITFLFYLAGEVISNLALVYKIKILNIFVSVHWNFTYLVDLKNNPFNFKPSVSIGVVLLYISVILCLTYAYFSKKDVKNI